MNEMAFLLRVVLGAVMRAFFPVMFAETKESLRDTAEDARPQPELKARLTQRIRGQWGRRVLTGGAALAVAICLAGCGTRTILVPDGDPVRLREPIKNAAVWVMGEDGQPVASTVDLPAGWYVVADPGDPPPESPTPVASTNPPPGVSVPSDIPTIFATPAPLSLKPLP